MKNKIVKRLLVASLTLALVFPSFTGVGAVEVNAAGKQIINCTFGENSADATGWSVDVAKEEVGKQQVNAISNGTFENGIDGWADTANSGATVEMVRDSSRGNVMKISGADKICRVDTTIPVITHATIETVTVEFDLMIADGEKGTATVTPYLTYMSGTSVKSDNICSAIKSTKDNGWQSFRYVYSTFNDYTGFRFQISGKKEAVYFDNVSVTYEQSTGESTWTDGVLAYAEGDYRLKLSNGKSATYSGATFEEGKWYEYSYDVSSDSEDGKSFECGLLINKEEKTDSSGKFKAKADTQIGFFTKGTGEAYFDNLVVTEHEHNYTQNVQNDKTQYQKATCTEPAQYYEYCSDCGECNKDVIYSKGNALGHNISSKQPEVPATCTTDGTNEYWPCDRCEKKFTTQDATTEIKDLKINKHTQTFVEKVPATCTTDGTEAHYKCQCEQLYKDEECKQPVTLNELKISKSNHSNKVHFKANEATCTEEGNTEYWSCPDCNELFGNEACENSIDKKDTVLEPIGHKASHIERVEATCTTNGNIEYWSCENCKKLYKDEKCTEIIDEKDTVIKAAGHKCTLVKKVEATCTTNGTEAYYRCESCKKLFADAKCTTEIKAAKVISMHKRTKVNAVAATYTKNGTAAHYRCSCGKLYLDQDGKKATTISALSTPVLKLTGTNVKKVTRKSKALAIKWTKKNGVSGYEVQVALKKNFKKGLKKTTVKSFKKTSVTVKKLKAKKTYYVRIRTYKVVSGKKVYSAWSAVKKAKTK